MIEKKSYACTSSVHEHYSWKKKHMITFRKNIESIDRESMESIYREKASIVKHLPSLYKDGEHNVISVWNIWKLDMILKTPINKLYL